MKIFVLIFWTLLSAQALSQSLLVGNAGEGILSGDHVYLRDLYEAGIHLNPVIGSQTDKEIVRLLESGFALDLNLNRDLLTRKLTDLNKTSPNLGYYVLKAIQLHTWVFIEHPLLPFPDDGSPLATKESRVPLANRFRHTIRIQKQLWEKLPKSHQVALVIHEALSSIQKLRCIEGTCEPDTHALREIVAYAFSGNTKHPATLTPNMEAELNIPSKRHRSECPAIRPQILVENLDKYSRDSIFYHNTSAGFEVRREFIEKICKNMSMNMRITLYRDALKPKEKIYLNQNNDHHYFQRNLEFEQIPSDWEFQINNLSFSNQSHCRNNLSMSIDAWYRYSAWTLISDPKFTCKAPLYLH